VLEHHLTSRCRYLLCLPLPILPGCVLRLVGDAGRVRNCLWELTHFSYAHLGLDSFQRPELLESRAWVNWWVAGDWRNLDSFVECVLYLMDMPVWDKVSVAQMDALEIHLRRWLKAREAHHNKKQRSSALYSLTMRGYDTPLLDMPYQSSHAPQHQLRRPGAESAEFSPHRRRASTPISPSSSSSTASSSAAAIGAPSSAVSHDTAASTPRSADVGAATSTASRLVEVRDEPSSPSSDSSSSTYSSASDTTPPLSSSSSPSSPSSIDPAALSVLQSMRATGLHLSYSSDLDVPDYSIVRTPFIRVCDRRVFAVWPIPALLRDDVAYMWDAGTLLNSGIEAKWAVSLYIPKRKDGAEAGEWCNVSVRPKRVEGAEDDGDRAHPHALDEALAAFMQRVRRVEEMTAAARPSTTAPTAATVTVAAATAANSRGASERESMAHSFPSAVTVACEASPTKRRVVVKRVKRRSEMASLADYLSAGSRYHAPSLVESPTSE